MTTAWGSWSIAKCPPGARTLVAALATAFSRLCTSGAARLSAYMAAVDLQKDSLDVLQGANVIRNFLIRNVEAQRAIS